MKQYSIFDYLPARERECKSCCWYDKTKERCKWLLYRTEEREKYLQGNCDEWRPNESMFKCCATCKHCNPFEYEGDDINNPVEEPNIYCTHRDGSLNRYCRWEDKWQKGFGVGTYHRQHEYDVCDRWELDKEWNKECEEL